MKVFMLLALLVMDCFAQGFKQDDNGLLIITEKADAVELSSAPQSADNRLDIRWLGVFVGAQALNRFETGSLIKTEVKPYATMMLGLGEKYTLQMQAVAPIRKKDAVLWKISIDRRIDSSLFR